MGKGVLFFYFKRKAKSEKLKRQKSKRQKTENQKPKAKHQNLSQ
jgi:hypothetical protein